MWCFLPTPAPEEPDMKPTAKPKAVPKAKESAPKKPAVATKKPAVSKKTSAGRNAVNAGFSRASPMCAALRLTLQLHSSAQEICLYPTGLA